MKWLMQGWALMGLTVLELLRRPLCLLLACGATALIILSPLLAVFHFGEEGKMVRDTAFAVQLTFGLALAGYASASVLDVAMGRGAALLVLSKPVGRTMFYLTRFLAVVAVVGMFSLAVSMAALVAGRVSERFSDGFLTDWQTGFIALGAMAAALVAAAWLNYRRRRVFASDAFLFLLLALALTLLCAGCFDRHGRWAPFDVRVEWRILPVNLLIAESLVLFAALVLFLSARWFRQGGLALAAGGLWVAGWMADALMDAPHTPAWRSAICHFLPDWQHFWMADMLNKGGMVAWSYVGGATLYMLLYATGLVLLGQALFKRREIR
jgi:hypothetical protein